MAMYWEYHFKQILNRYNEIYRTQIPRISPYVYRFCCSNMAKSEIDPKTLQYLLRYMWHRCYAEYLYTLEFEDAEDELKRMKILENARTEGKGKK